MKNILLLAKTNIKRNYLGVLIAIVGVSVLCFIMYLMGAMVVEGDTSNIKLGMIDSDQSNLSEDFKKYLKEELHYDLIEDCNFNQLSMKLIDKDISAIIEIPEDFQQQISIGNKREVVMTTLDDYENVVFLQTYINSYMNSIMVLSKTAAGDTNQFNALLSIYQEDSIHLTSEAAQIVDSKLTSDRDGFILSAGFFLMFIFWISIIISFMVLNDRLSGVFQRIQITPVKPVHYILGSGIFGMFICMLQVVIFCAYIDIMDIQTGVPIKVSFLLMTLFSAFTVCLAIAIALALQSRSAVTSIIIGFSTIGCCLGGAYFPVDLAPKSLQNLARVLPQFWFMDALRRLQEDSMANISTNIIILSLFVILIILIGAVLFTQNIKSK